MINNSRKGILCLGLAGMACMGLLAVGCTDRKAASAVGGAGAKAPAAVAPTGNPADIVVEVDGAKLTRGEMDTKIAAFFASGRAGRMPPDQQARARTQIEGNIVNGFVAHTLLVNEANKKGIAVEPAEVDQTIDEIRAKVPPGVTLEQMLTDGAMTLGGLRTNVEQQLQIKKMIGALTTNLPAVKDEDIKAFYESAPRQFDAPESVRARHILVKCEPSAETPVRDTKRKQIEEIRQKLVDGADFAALARECSDCPSKAKGGDLGTFGRGTMAKPFEEAAFAQKTNEVGSVVETQFGYHVIQVLAHTQAGPKSLDEVKPAIRSMLKARREQETVMGHVRELQKEAKIKYGQGFQPAAATPFGAAPQLP
jgi:peptidyl-prolyl cis-trans isomerase C